jgi:uncharacterized protein YgfB (UPF0149 family)
MTRSEALETVLLQYHLTGDVGQAIEDIHTIMQLSYDEWREQGETEGWL